MEGGCLCGAIRYELTEPPVAQAVCHCKNCQKQAGSAFSVLVVAKKRAFQLSGEPALYVDAADSGAPVNRYFCAGCGSPIYTALPSAPDDVYVKAGTLDDTSALKPKVHVWCDSAWPWTPIPEGAIKIGRNPPARGLRPPPASGRGGSRGEERHGGTMSRTLNSAIAWWARMQPDKRAVWVDGASATYREYHEWSERIAAWLIADGLQPGERVGVSAANSLEYCALAHGVIRAGGILTPINMRFTRHEVAEWLEDTTPRMLFCDAERRDRLDGVAPRMLDLAMITELRTGPRAEVEHDVDPDAPIVIISTSGSTARPKGVVYSHRTMLGYITEFALEEPTISQGAKVLGIAPMSASAGFVQLMHYTTLGCSLHLDSAFEPAKVLRMINEEKINSFGGVPLLFERIAALPEFATADLSSLRLATVGGAPVTRTLLDAWMAKGVVLRQIYGQTEAGGNSTIMPRHLALEQPEKCGWGGIFTEHRIRAPDGRICGPNELGEILIRGPGVMLGYWNNPQATAETIRDGWLHSGDLGMLDEQGLLTFVDRIKDIIISGGLNISAAEVERAVSEFPGVEEAVVIAAPDPKFAETPMAVVYASRPIDVPALVQHCNGRLADYKVPRYIVVEDEPLPRLATGKLSKPAIRAKYKDAVATLPRVR